MSRTPEEQKAYDDVLTWCRKETGRVMRKGVQEQPACRVIDLRRRPVDEVIAEGSTWLECREVLDL